ncbi:MAG: hypothetical protein KDD55_11370 [Bdellovibrionales bacterium]|nr:hypothetical protein [Bdellovibrionales bacterium]
MNQLAEDTGSTIVECPSCHVEFWVDTGLLSSMEEPCFHCSKCDQVFHQEGATLVSENLESEIQVEVAEEEPVANLQPAAIDDLISVLERESIEGDVTARQVEETFDEELVDYEEEGAWSILPEEEEESSFFSHDPEPFAEEEFDSQEIEELESSEGVGFEAEEAASFSEPSGNIAETSHEMIQESFHFEETPVRPLKDSKPKKVVPTTDVIFNEIEEDQETSFAQRTASPVSDPFEADLPLESFRVGDDEGGTPLATEIITDLAARQEELDLDDTLVRPHLSSEVVELNFSNDEEGQEHDSHFDSTVLADLPDGPPSAPSSLSRVFLFVGAPLCIFLVVLGIAGHLLGASSNAAQYASLLFPHEFQAAPPEVRIVRSHFKRIELDTGEAVYAIIGKLKNDSVHTLSDVLLEGVVFDNDGQPLVSKKVSLSPVMNKELSALTPEVIDRLQNTPPRKLMVRPREKKQFAIVFMADELSAAQFFTTRVYSVHY